MQIQLKKSFTYKYIHTYPPLKNHVSFNYQYETSKKLTKNPYSQSGINWPSYVINTFLPKEQGEYWTYCKVIWKYEALPTANVSHHLLEFVSLSVTFANYMEYEKQLI